MDGRARRAAAGADDVAGDRAVPRGPRRSLVTRREVARARDELAGLHDAEPDEDVRDIVRCLVALRDAPIPDGLAHALARRAPAFVLAYARACELADELEDL